jgi:Rrf2 family iron-sulfur cluster assembly transcriptional regulator
MKISTKGRYALRVMIDLAEHNTGDYIPLMDIARRQEISEKYLEAIIGVLSKHQFVHALRGKGGGYRLARQPEEYTVGSILKLVEGPFAPVACLEAEPNACPRAGACKTLRMWTDLYRMVDSYFEGITLADLAAQSREAGPGAI